MARAKPFLPITKRRELAQHFTPGSKLRSFVQLMSSSNKPISTQKVLDRVECSNITYLARGVNKRLAILGYPYRVTGFRVTTGVDVPGREYLWRMARVEGELSAP